MTTLEILRGAPALSIRQPWAELIISGRKDVELRNWTDRYRGVVWLHTGAKSDDVAEARFGLRNQFRGGLVGFAELVEIRMMTFRLFRSWEGRHLDFSPFPHDRDLYGWNLANAVRLARPQPCKGALKLFSPDTSGLSDLELLEALLRFNRCIET
jgi:hypothetical protein